MVKNMNNVICIGNLNYNMNLYVNSYPIEDQISNIVKKNKTIGSNLNVPIILSKYELNVYLFSNIGDDLEGKEIINYLHSNKINTDYINTINNTFTNKRYIIRNIKNDTKTILSEKVRIKYLLDRDLNFVPNIIYTDTYEVDLIKQLKNKYKNVKLITNLNEISTEALNTCVISDYIIISLKYAEILTNVKINLKDKNSIINLYLKTKKLFSGKILIYIEQLGCLFENNNIIGIISKMGDKNLVSKNSFDIFISTFIYSIINNFDISKAIKISTIAKFLSDNNKQNLNINEVVEIYEKNS